MFKSLVNFNNKIIEADKNLNKIRFLSNNSIKFIAILAMFADHFSKVVWPYLRIDVMNGMTGSNFDFLNRFMTIFLQGVGTMAFPLFCFLLCEGFCYTRSRKKYLMLLLIFGIISEIPFDLAFFYGFAITDGTFPFYFGYQNVFFTLFLGLLTLCLIDKFSSNSEKKLRKLLSYIMWALCIGVMAIIAYLLKTDFSYKGILFISSFYILRKNRIFQIIMFIILYFVTKKSLSIFIIIVGIIILLYNGKRGKLKLKYFFYLFYPAHLIILYLVSLMYK